MQNYFGVNYTLRKLDQIGIDIGSATRGMENWGLIVYEYIF